MRLLQTLLRLLLTGLILLPLITVFARAVIIDGRLDLYQAWGIVAGAENLQTICNSVLLVILVAVGIPYFAIISASLIKLRGYGLAAGNFTLAHYQELLTTPKALDAVWKSLFLAVSSATICSVIGTAVVVCVCRVPR